MSRPALNWLTRLRCVDWRTVLMMLPQRRFTPEELRRAAADPPSTSLRVAVVLNVVIVVLMQLAAFARALPLNYSLVLVGLGVLAPAAMELAWRDPSRPLVRQGYYWLSVLLAFAAGVLQIELGPQHRDAGMLLSWTVLLLVLTVWSALVHRHRVILLRLAELDERERAIDMARQLGTAQIQPHFLFNTLASLQHWVNTGDARAGPMLASLTGYLRATLPLFEQQSLSLDRELEAVRRYLEVMQARLGERLRFRVDAAPQVLGCLLPPGLLLTLVENAIEHGITPQLVGGEVQVRAELVSDQVLVQIDDDGPGLAEPLPATSVPDYPAAGHLGLVNTRARLARAFAERASLQLFNRPGGGCRAELRLPLTDHPQRPAKPGTNPTVLP